MRPSSASFGAAVNEGEGFVVDLDYFGCRELELERIKQVH